VLLPLHWVSDARTWVDGYPNTSRFSILQNATTDWLVSCMPDQIISNLWDFFISMHCKFTVSLHLTAELNVMIC